MNDHPTLGDMLAHAIKFEHHVEPPVFSEQAAVERRVFDLEMVTDDLIAAHNATPAYVAMNYLELISAKTKLDFLLSAIRPATAVE